VSGRALGLLLGGGTARGGLRVWRAGEEVAGVLATGGGRPGELRPYLLDLSAHRGAQIVLEVFDDDPNASVQLDALRWWDDAVGGR
jgi:hypothetical protein